MQISLFSFLLAIAVFLLPPAVLAQDATLAPGESSCQHCHTAKRHGFNASHGFAADNCIACHGGDNRAVTQADAHARMVAFPGNLENAQQSCGACHADQVSSVHNSLMHSGHGIVEVTRRLVDGEERPTAEANLQSLTHSPADSMLRKLCASCHLGQEKTEHKLDPLTDRGGGCLACHINSYPEDAHPALSRKVSDGRCFGCHSRSGRISLSYTGLAEVETAGEISAGKRLRLADGRSVERMPADIHYLAGMGCIDCHTSVGVMGDGSSAGHQRDAVDISCEDCHVSPLEQPASTTLKTARHGTPLEHIELRADGPWLQSKTSGRTLRIPTLGASHAENTAGHERLECVSCHSQWAPRCFGCHMSYDEQGSQWDHVERKETPGRWHEQRSEIHNGLAALGVNQLERIELFVPGMIMSLVHPDWEEDKFVRVFAPLSPHTSGASRSCESCHRSSSALGLGEGDIVQDGDGFHFTPHGEILPDGLSLDAWTDLHGKLGGGTPVQGQRPLSKEEMEAVLSAPLPE